MSFVNSSLKTTPSFSKKFFTILTAFLIATGIFSFAINLKALALEGAQWGNSDKTSIVYNNKTYVKATDTSGFPSEVKKDSAFVYKTPVNASGEQKAEVISVESTDGEKFSGKLFKFDLTATGNYKQTGQAEPISGEGTSANAGSSTSCAIEGGGGWIVCMISNTLASAMDGLYDVLQGFLVVQPLQVSSKSGLFQVWDYMRNIANIIFVVIFILVIYSQITNVGISNYGIKKLLPKLIVAAILINISYYICALAVDLSNVVGAQFQNLLVGIRKDIFENGSGIQLDAISWKSLVAGILSGSGFIAMGAWSFTMMGGPQNLGVMICFVLLIVLYSIFVGVVVLAARQAIITILIFLAPLAFVANVWPNTEKWFEKWKDLFFTMLIMYPLIALLFGGSQLAGIAIIANSNGNLVTLILGMVVQIVPLAITPTITRLSGGLLGRFAGIINNSNKGPIDSAKKFLREEMDHRTNKKISTKPTSLTARAHQMRYNRSRRVGASKSIAEQYQKARFDLKEAKDVELATNTTDAFKRDKIMAKNTMFQQEMAKAAADDASKRSESAMSGYKASLLNHPLELKDGKFTLNNAKVETLEADLGRSSAKLYELLNNTHAQSQAVNNNNSMINDAISKTFTENQDLRNISRGQRGEAGETVALARAFETAQKAQKEEISAISSLVKSLDLTGDELNELVINGKNLDKNGIKISNDKNLKIAAMDEFMKKASEWQARDAVNLTENGKSLHEIRSVVIDKFMESKKADFQWVGGGAAGGIAANGIGSGGLEEIMLNGYSSKNSDKSIMSASANALKIVYDQIPKMNNQTIESTLRSFMSINNDSSKYGEIKAEQGTEIHNALVSIRRHHKEAFERVNSELLAEAQKKNPSIKSIDWDLKNIKKKA